MQSHSSYSQRSPTPLSYTHDPAHEQTCPAKPAPRFNVLLIGSTPVVTGYALCVATGVALFAAAFTPVAALLTLTSPQGTALICPVLRMVGLRHVASCRALRGEVTLTLDTSS